jgi:hypothetical protein
MARDSDLGNDIDDEAGAPSRHPGAPVPGHRDPDSKPADKYAAKVSVPGAIAGGVFNAAAIALIAAVPGFNLPFITASFAAITIPLMAGPLASATSAFMRLGYVTPITRNLSGMVERAAGAWGCWAMYTFYPLALTAIGLPPVVDTVLKILFGVGAVVNGIGVIVNFARLFRGNKGGLTKRDMKRLERMDKIMERRKKEQDSFFEDD